MQAKAYSTGCNERVISEASGKRLLNGYGERRGKGEKWATVDHRTNWEELTQQHPWLTNQPGLVVKPDQSIKRRKQLGLVQLNVDLQTAKRWIKDKIGTRIQADGIEGTLKQFIIEPFVPHQQNEECYLCIYSLTESQDVVLFHHKGGVDVGNVDEKALCLPVGLKETPEQDKIQNVLLKNVPDSKKQMLGSFIQSLIGCFRDMHFTYLEINPLVVTESEIHVLDVAAKLDAKAAPLCKDKWRQVQFAPSLCRDPYPEELQVAKLSANSPCSMHLTLLNKAGRIWSLVSGGGTSLVICDTAKKLGVEDELACYTQFSGRPSADQLYGFTKTLITLMTEQPRPEGKTLILSSNVADMVMMVKLGIEPMTGMIKALQECKERLQNHNVTLFVRRATTATLPIIPTEFTELGIPVHVFSIDVSTTNLLKRALGMVDTKTDTDSAEGICLSSQLPQTNGIASDVHGEDRLKTDHELFNKETRVVVIGLMNKAIQAMLDFDFVCGRKVPSVAAIVNPGGDEDKEENFLWDEGQVGIPAYGSVETAVKNHPDVSVVVNSAPGADTFHCAMQALKCRQVRCILMIAGHIPDQQTRILLQMAKNNGVMMIGPCAPTHLMQVNFINPGSFRCNKFGNIGGTLDDLVSLRLYRPGSVGYVTRSGGLSMELLLHVARNTDGLYQGVSLGGGKFTGSSFMDHLLSLEANPEVKILLLLGEFGGSEEHDVCEALRSGRITKPMVAFCIGECADMFRSEPGHFGHAGAGSDVAMETAAAKNKALAEAGAAVPKTFDEIGVKLREVYNRLVSEGKLVPRQEPPVPSIPANMKPRKGKK